MGSSKSSFSEIYHSFLIRIWSRVPPVHTSEEWEGEIHHLQEGRVYRFDNLAELIERLVSLLWEEASESEEKPAENSCDARA